ncbi:MAG: DNA-protecting protein DprA [Pseudomonadota bacterium]|jgi:DNA processing protein
MKHDALAAWLRLSLTPGVGCEAAHRMLQSAGSAEAVWAQDPADWTAVVGHTLASALRDAPPDWDATLARHQQWLSSSPEHHWLSWADADYPADLLNTPDPPLMLWVQGQRAALSHPFRLAIVGSRNPTPQGQSHARDFAQALGQAGVCVVSGLALGVDGAAHEGALLAQAPTLAVVGTGLDRVYPRRHTDLARRIAAGGGALISEYPLGTPPLPHHFPRRNRIISGLSEAVLVVQAAMQSGSLITAKQALEQGRDVMAIPGSIHEPQSKGCHALIRQGAKLVESARDVLEDLRGTPIQSDWLTAPISANEPEDVVLNAMGFEALTLDHLQARCAWPTEALQAHLLTLELDGRVARVLGGRYQRIERA